MKILATIGNLLMFIIVLSNSAIPSNNFIDILIYTLLALGYGNLKVLYLIINYIIRYCYIIYFFIRFLWLFRIPLIFAT